MKSLKDAIEQKGLIISDEVLKVDSFLNHQIDCPLVMKMADEFYEHFKDKKITKIVTIESSGVAPSFATACRFGVPMVFIKKAQPSTMQDPVSCQVFSFTKNKYYPICMERQYLSEEDNVLFIDDFLANGEAFKAAENLIKECGANISGVGIVIEKAFQKGHKYIVDAGYDFCALASIASIKDKKITWAE
ncbi:xanthine phosphoribosyltransferase [Faecalitalea cylindroides]|uniref:xanthine phosphoribosyltransferase n=1 Tax=Faecalitalea cylindroides TaxID=39483 RepID=UPI00195A7258|nr:xanthine phosphoribosyltransferase [Faecalitalea cylindroides]MBM6810386.1 xanthine phosphoribosyltransferase [Faecalitalea cylindroides]